MTASSVPPHATPSTIGPTRMARWAVVLATIVAVVVVVSYVIFGVAFAVGGDEAISDTWVGYLAGTALLGGLAASLVAFVMAVVAKVRHQHQALLWLPLTVFPVLASITLVAELFWME